MKESLKTLVYKLTIIFISSSDTDYLQLLPAYCVNKHYTVVVALRFLIH